MAPDPAHADPTPGRMRPKLICAVVTIWLTVQLVIPAVQLVDRGSEQRPRVFGWQMFSHTLDRPAEQFSVVAADGTVTEVDVRPLLSGPMRREIRYAPELTDILCSRDGVVAVDVDDVDDGRSRMSCP